MATQYPSPSNLPDPFLPASTGVHNLRHLGGYALNAPSAIGHLPSYCIKPHVIFRSAEPSHITPEGIALLNSYNVKTVFDMRGTSEIEKHNELMPPKTWEGVTRISVPCSEDDNKGPEQLAERYKVFLGDGPQPFVRAYKDMLETGAPAFATIFKHLAKPVENPPEAILVHCAVGKDRTGLFAALALSLMGADDEDVARDYSLTELGLGEWTPLIVEFLMRSGAFERTEDAEKMSSARKEYMLGTMAMIRENWGSAEGYLRSRCNLSSEEIDGIKRRLVCEEVAVLNGF